MKDATGLIRVESVEHNTMKLEISVIKHETE